MDETLPNGGAMPAGKTINSTTLGYPITTVLMGMADAIIDHNADILIFQTQLELRDDVTEDDAALLRAFDQCDTALRNLRLEMFDTILQRQDAEKEGDR